MNSAFFWQQVQRRKFFISKFHVPQNFVAQSIFNYHKTEVPAPIRGVKLYCNFFVLCHAMYKAHCFQISADCSFFNFVLRCQLYQRLLSLYIISYDLRFIAVKATSETTATVLTFISLLTPSETIVDHIV